MRTPKIFIITIGLILSIQACKPGYQEKLAAVNTVRVTKVKVTQVNPMEGPIPLSASGLLASKSQALLSFKVGGVIDRIFIEEGQTFKKGQVLARLELTEINSRVLQAEENVKKLTRDRDRVSRLYQDTVATLEQLQDITTALEVAQAELDIANYNRQYATIVAKESGKVLRRMAERGELTAAGNPLFQVALNGQSKSHVLKIGVADRDVVKVQLGDSAKVSFDAFPGKTFLANVSEIAEAADPFTGTFELELTLQAEGVPLKDGFVAKLEVFPSRQAPYYKIPISALVEGDKEEAIIYIPDQNSVKPLRVHPDYITDHYFTISIDEMKGQGEVVTQGAAYAKPGEAVEIINDRP